MRDYQQHYTIYTRYVEYFFCQNLSVMWVIFMKFTEYFPGCCFAGAGGGGYLFVITKEPNIHTKIEGILQDLPKVK